MTDSTGVLIGFLVAFVALGGTVVRVTSRQRMDLIDWFSLSFGYLNGLGLSLVIWATTNGLNTAFWSVKVTASAVYYAYYGSACIILLSAVWTGGRLMSRTSRPRHSAHYSRRPKRFVRRAEILAWTLLSAAVLLYWAYARPYGGFRGLLEVGTIITSGLFELIPTNRLSFLRPFGGLAFFSSFLFCALLTDRNATINRARVGAGFLLSFSFSIFVLYSWLSRVWIVVYLLTFAFYWVVSKHRSSPRALLPVMGIMLIGLCLLTVSDSVLETGKGDENVVRFFAKELSFPPASFFTHLDDARPRYLQDLLAAPLYILPQKVWSGQLGLQTASEVNTQLIMGAAKGESGVTGGIPVDIVTFSFMQLGVAGLVIVGLAWGAFLSVFDRFILAIPTKEIAWIVYSYALLQVCVLTPLYGDPEHIIVRSFPLIVGLIGLSICKGFKKSGAMVSRGHKEALRS